MASIETEEEVHTINLKSNSGTARKHDWRKGGLFCDFETDEAVQEIRFRSNSGAASKDDWRKGG
jgi:hypothetical protein